MNKQEYGEYLLTPHWRAKRAQRMEMSDWACDSCGKTADHVHHLTYERLGNEDLRDLIPLCVDCHYRIHDLIDKKRISLFGDPIKLRSETITILVRHRVKKEKRKKKHKGKAINPKERLKLNARMKEMRDRYIQVQKEINQLESSRHKPEKKLSLKEKRSAFYERNRKRRRAQGI